MPHVHGAVLPACALLRPITRGGAG